VLLLNLPTCYEIEMEKSLQQDKIEIAKLVIVKICFDAEVVRNYLCFFQNGLTKCFSIYVLVVAFKNDWFSQVPEYICKHSDLSTFLRCRTQ
jgi:hypothetical protein